MVHLLSRMACRWLLELTPIQVYTVWRSGPYVSYDLSVEANLHRSRWTLGKVMYIALRYYYLVVLGFVLLHSSMYAVGAHERSFNSVYVAGLPCHVPTAIQLLIQWQPVQTKHDASTNVSYYH